eukprot:COSAG02_NODE_5501_length_4277_cov_2.321129_3_plen_102_part_00
MYVIVYILAIKPFEFARVCERHTHAHEWQCTVPYNIKLYTALHATLADYRQRAPALSHSCRSDMPENHAIVAGGDAAPVATSPRMERVARGGTVVSSGGGG